MVTPAQAVLIIIILLYLCGHSVYAQFKVFRGDEVEQVLILSDVERLVVAAKTGEAHTVELTDSYQAGVVQEDVSISIDCLPLLRQRSLSSRSMTSLKWTFVQLNEFGETVGKLSRSKTKVITNKS